MGKLITLKDRITGESIYPNIPTTAVINKNGSNILGEIESKVGEINKSLNNALSSITTSLNKIKKLEGLDISKDEKDLSLNLVRIQENRKELEVIEEQNAKIDNKIKEGIEKSNVSTESSTINNVIDYFDNRIYIRSGKAPTSNPNKQQIRVGTDGYLYISTGKVWYKSKKAFLTVSQPPTVDINKILVVVNIDTEWISNVYIWENDSLLFTLSNSSNVVPLPKDCENLTLTADLIYEADTLQIYKNDLKYEVDSVDGVYYNIFKNINSGDTLSINTYNSSIEGDIL